jgi:hypothetical protein
MIAVNQRRHFPALREIERLASNAEAEEVASFVRGLIDKTVMGGDILTVYYALNELEELDLVVQLWLPGQDSNLQPSG